MLLRDGRPDEHGRLRRFHVPASAISPSDEGVPALLIYAANLLGILGALAQRDDGGDLNGLEHAVIEIAFDARQSSDHFLIPDAEPPPPARHVEALRHGVNLHCDFLGPLYL